MEEELAPWENDPIDQNPWENDPIDEQTQAATQPLDPRTTIDGPKGQETVGGAVGPSGMTYAEDPGQVANQSASIQSKKNLAGGLWNAGKQAVQNSAVVGGELEAQIDQIENPVLRMAARAANFLANPLAAMIGPEAGEVIEETIPEYQPEAGMDRMMTEGTSLAAGMAIGAKGINVQSIQGFPRLLANLGRFAGIETMGTQHLDEDVKTLITGDNAEFGQLLGSVGLDETGNYNEQYAKHRINLAMEAIAIAKAGDVTIRGAGGAFKFLKSQTYDRLVNWGDLSAKERIAAEDMITEMLDFHPNDTPEIEAQKIQAFADKIRKGAEVEFKSDVPGVGTAKIKRPTMRAAIEGGMDTPIARARGAGLHATALSKGATELEAAVAQPSLQLDETLKQTRKVFGDREEADVTRKAILDDAAREAEQMKAPITAKEAQVAQADTELSQVVQDDPTFGPVAQEIDQPIDIGVKKKNIDRQTEIVKKQREIEQADKKIRDDAYDAIPENTPADMDSFNKVYEEVKGFIPEPTRKLIEKNNGTFRYLNKEVRPKLSGLITDAFNRNEGHVADQLIKLRDNITKEQIAYLTEHGNEVAINTAKEANKANIVYADKHNQGVNRELKTNAKINRPDKQTIDWLEKGRPIVKKAITDPNRRESTEQLIKTLTPENEHLVADVAIGDFVEDMLGKGKFSEIDVDQMAKSLTDSAAAFSPAQQKRINDFLNKVKTSKGNIESMKAEVDGMRKAAEEAKNQIYKKELKKFFDAEGFEIDDPDLVFERHFSDVNNEGIGKIKRLMERAKSNPVAGDGLKSTYAKYAAKKLFRGGEGGAGQKNINQETVKQIREGTEKLFEIGDAIHGKNSSVMKLYRGLVNEAAKNDAFGSAKKVPMSAVDKSDKEARSAFDLIITAMFGQLSRTGARLRAVTGRVVSSKSSKQQTIDAMSAMMADPERAANMIEQIAKDRGNYLSKDNKKRFYNFLVTAGVYTGQERDQLLEDDELDKQTKDNLK